MSTILLSIFFFNDTAPTEIYTLSLHDALPISASADLPARPPPRSNVLRSARRGAEWRRSPPAPRRAGRRPSPRDRKSTRLNSSHQIISYAVFCLKKKKIE